MESPVVGRLKAALRRLLRLNLFHWIPAPLLGQVLARCGLFDVDWYGQSVGKRFSSRTEAALAFLRGASAPQAGNPLFDADWYCRQHSFSGTAAEALLHYWAIGERFGYRPHPWFDPRFVRTTCGLRVRQGGILARFLRDPRGAPAAHPHFDTRWYLERYCADLPPEANPLAHYVAVGASEGRQPNRYLVPSWYLKRYGDVAASGMDPALHFNLHGAHEGRSPGPEFDSHQYQAANPQQAHSGLDPLAHYLWRGRQEGATLGPRVVAVADLRNRGRTNALRAPSAHGKLDIIIPVYRGLEITRNCLQSVLASTSLTQARVRVVNDASPEPELTSFLRAIGKEQPSLLLSENERNLGFVGTVNRAMRAAMSCEDSLGVIILNSDTEVAPGWVDRLFAHAASNAGIGTVTAMSNNGERSAASLASEPTQCYRARAPKLLDHLSIFANAGEAVEVPTGVGFCMLISRRCLDEVGFFDEEAFGRGYGEENDFCMRAAQAGFKHLLALDVFVRHVGEVSFAADSKPGKQHAERVIRERYPEYASKVGEFVSADPAAVGRLRLLLAVWRASARPVCAFVTHDCGGGTERHVQEAARQYSESGGRAIILRPARLARNALLIENIAAADRFCVTIALADGADFAELLRLIGVTNVQVHHLMGHGDVLREGLAASGLEYEFIVHDYYTLCPQVTMTTEDGRYCGEPGPNECDSCIRSRPSHGAVDIRNWRIRNSWAVLGACRVVAPSEDTAKRVARYLGVRPEVRYHQPLLPPSVVRRSSASHRPLVIVLLGALAAHKGRRLVFEAARLAGRGRAVRFHLIGDTHGAVPADVERGLTWTGPYRQSELLTMIEQADPDAFLFPSQCPETYSYTLSEAMATGRPIVATDIGAFPERLTGYRDSLLVPHHVSGEALVQMVVQFLTRAR